MSEHQENSELTPRERRQFEALPRERIPPPSLEERVVDSLRGRGLLRRPSRRWRPPRPAVAGGIAAAIALFLGGLAVGQWLGARAVAGPDGVGPRTPFEVAARVQRTGTDYVNAVASLAQLADSTASPAVEQGREAALTALYTAALQAGVFAADDPLLVLLRDRLTRSAASPEEDAGPSGEGLIWY